ncbi:CaiB/BaiF CoA transferase family protein [Rhodovibrionaceae bacterium A322]
MTSPAPLEGLTVLDFTSMIAGPYCTRLLADVGATVIKIETADGDYIRQVAPHSYGVSRYFTHMNCGKKSVVLDLTDPSDLQRALELAQTADVVVENFRPGVMAKLGLSWKVMKERNPALIYCSISGYGQTGPRAQTPAYAPIVHASSGYDDTMARFQEDLDGPLSCGVPTADMLAGIYAFSAIQTALIGRQQQGLGQHIDVSLMDSMINLMVYDTQVAQQPLDEPRAVYVPIRAADGYVAVAPINARNFEAMADVMGHPGWKSDPRFATVKNRRANWKTLMALAEEWTLKRSAEDCERLLSAARVPCAKYQSLLEALSDPQTEHRQLLVKVEDADGGVLVPNPPFKFADGSVGVRPTVPEIGQHTDEILTGL